MPSGIQPEGRSILDGNGDAAAAGAANAPRAIATANRIVRGRRVISNLPWRWLGDDGVESPPVWSRRGMCA
jgi:hypothetical protein